MTKHYGRTTIQLSERARLRTAFDKFSPWKREKREGRLINIGKILYILLGLCGRIFFLNLTFLISKLSKILKNLYACICIYFGRFPIVKCPFI